MGSTRPSPTLRTGVVRCSTPKPRPSPTCRPRSARRSNWWCMRGTPRRVRATPPGSPAAPCPIDARKCGNTCSYASSRVSGWDAPPPGRKKSAPAPTQRPRAASGPTLRPHDPAPPDANPPSILSDRRPVTDVWTRPPYIARNGSWRNGTATVRARVERMLGAPRSRSVHARRSGGGAWCLQKPFSRGVVRTA